MKNILIMVAFVTSIFPAYSQEKLSDDQKAVQNTVIKMFDALSNRDSAALKMHCTADILLFEYGQTWNLDTLIKKAIKLNQSKDFKRINTINFINTTIEQNVAWTTYNNQADITQNGNLRTIHWIETVVLVRERKTWKMKVLHSTLLKKS